MLSLRGKGGVALRRTLELGGQGLQATSKLIAEPLHLTGANKHLGVWVQMKGFPWKDFCLKLASAHWRITQYKTALFRNKFILIKRKMQLFGRASRWLPTTQLADHLSNEWRGRLTGCVNYALR